MKHTKKDKWTAIDSPAARLVNNLFRARNHIWRSDQRIVVKHGLTWSQFSTLLSLRTAYPECTLAPTEIYSAAQVTSGGLTKMLASLEEQGLIVRRENKEDKRSRFVRLTPQGRRKVETVVDELVDTNSHLLEQSLNKHDITQLITILGKLSAGLDTMA